MQALLRKSVTSILLLGFALLIGAAAVVYGLAHRQLHTPLDPRGQEREVRVAGGLTLQEVRDLLVAEGLVGERVPLVWWGRLTGLDRRVQSGTYALSPAQSPREILDRLVEGRTLQVRVTIPEGWTADRILDLLGRELDLPAEQLAAAAGDTAWIRSLGLGADRLEGYLFPETYVFERHPSPKRVLARMVAEGLARWDAPRRTRAAELGMSRHEVLTLASIVQAEAALEEEMTRIAAVYHNRLRQGRLLQADPTVAYAVGRTGQRIWAKHLTVDSPYNTYLYPGLPPGPICSPGEACIDAALYPLADCRDLYFVARGDGTHVFSRTLEEHNRARARVRRP